MEIDAINRCLAGTKGGQFVLLNPHPISAPFSRETALNLAAHLVAPADERSGPGASYFGPGSSGGKFAATLRAVLNS